MYLNKRNFFPEIEVLIIDVYAYTFSYVMHVHCAKTATRPCCMRNIN